MNIQIYPMDPQRNKYRRIEAVGQYFKDSRSIELSSTTFESTEEVLIHEIHHQVLHELIGVTACEKYDEIATEFDAFISEGFSPCNRCKKECEPWNCREMDEWAHNKIA